MSVFHRPLAPRPGERVSPRALPMPEEPARPVEFDLEDDEEPADGVGRIRAI